MSNRLWGGRFSEKPDSIMSAINASIGVDQRLYAQDIQGSCAHVKMLAKQGIVSQGDAEKIVTGLLQIKNEIDAGTFEFSQELEDIHLNIEARLTERIGAAGGRLHTARSRNDQVATDFRLWVRDQIASTVTDIETLQKALAERALEHFSAAMPGFTHLQSAQPITFGHHLLAYVEMLERDKGRFVDCAKRLNECPLGAAALAGTPFPIDRFETAKALGFDKPMANSLDAVSSRDFAMEALSSGAIMGAHLSRLAEEFILWTTPQFGFVSLSDKFTTGSSIMPQKRNPDAAELVRGKTGRLNGNLVGMLTLLKALPLAYAKDLQEDKELTFDTFDTLALVLGAMIGMVRDMSVHEAHMRKSANSGYSTATDLADWLVRVLGMPFREAHHVTGRIVALAAKEMKNLDKLTLAQLQSVEPKITEDVFEFLSVNASLKSRTSYGGTAPNNVRNEAKKWIKKLAKGTKI